MKFQSMEGPHEKIWKNVEVLHGVNTPIHSTTAGFSALQVSPFCHHLVVATCHGRCQAWKDQDALQAMELFWASGWACWLSCIKKGKGKWRWVTERNTGPIALLQQQLNLFEAQQVKTILKVLAPVVVRTMRNNWQTWRSNRPLCLW